ncbi:MAG TPA: L-aspartate oxidase [Acidimicrobiales bacterium]|nr:L-aspartate oxidase [Acidimicrobiales bacterium]
MEGDLDVLVIGSGVAGLTAAVRAAAPAGQKRLRVGVVTKAELSQATTRWAQGGIAAVLGGNEDSTDLHMADTLAAGDGLCDVEAVRLLVDEGPRRVMDLISMGAQFDKESGGDFSLAREGGHSKARVIHSGGAATGAEIERALVEAVRSSATVVFEKCFASELIVEDGRCFGVKAVDADGKVRTLRSRNTILASGGAGQLFSVTTNPHESTGDGIAMALMAGVPVADLEFFQFHPTALHHPEMPRPLLSEALRGHGALLRDSDGDRFVNELSSRDVVSRAMARKMIEQGVDHLWLDATEMEDFQSRFPTIAESLANAGLDPSRDWLPIAPAAHHLSGGVLTDLEGSSGLPGLWACGEVACSGVHGANRLASNSLLEGMVFGARVVDSIVAGRSGPQLTGAIAPFLAGFEGTDNATIPLRSAKKSASQLLAQLSDPFPTGMAGPGATVPGDMSELTSTMFSESPEPDMSKLRETLQTRMTSGAGVLRDAVGLDGLLGFLNELRLGFNVACRPNVQRAAPAGNLDVTAFQPAGELRDRGGFDALELRNLLVCAQAMVESADQRKESRGAHSRQDFRQADPKFRFRIVHSNE